MANNYNQEEPFPWKIKKRKEINPLTIKKK